MNKQALAATAALIAGAGSFLMTLNFGGGGWEDACSSQRTWVVTTTATSGPGSLQAARDSVVANNDEDTCQFIVFRRGGTYQFSADRVDTGLRNLRVSGQLASGIVNVVGGNRFQIQRGRGIRIEYLTSRGSQTFFPIVYRCASDVEMNNLSISYTARTGGANLLQWGCTSAQHQGQVWGNVVFRNNIACEPHADHPTSMHMGGAEDYPEHFAEGFLVYENYLCGPGHRHPLFSDIDLASAIRNISYNSTARAAEVSSGARRVDIINHYHKNGPATRGSRSGWPVLVHTGPNHHLSLHVAGVRGPQNGYANNPSYSSNVSGSNRVLACSENSGICANMGDPVPSQYLRTDTLPVPSWVTWQPMTDAEVDRILSVAGDYRRVSETGQWVAQFDSVTARYINDFYNGTGATAPLQTHLVRHYPAPAAGTPPADTDGDGLFDVWEQAQCGTTTCVDPDVRQNGKFPIQWLLEGRNLDGTLVGSDEDPDPPPPPPPPPPSEREKRFYLLDLEPIPGGYRVPDLTASDTSGVVVWPSGDTLGIVVTHDSLYNAVQMSQSELSAACVELDQPCDRVRATVPPGEVGP